MNCRLRLSDKTVRKFAELPIYCQRQKCSPGNVVSGSIRFMQIFAGVRWRWGVKWAWGSWKWRFSVHSVTVFRTFYIRGHTTAFRWYDCQWPWAYFKVIGLFHIKFLKNGVWDGKSYYRLLIGNHVLPVKVVGLRSTSSKTRRPEGERRPRSQNAIWLSSLERREKTTKGGTNVDQQL